MRTTSAFLALSLCPLLGCGGSSSRSTSASSSGVDRDGDGFADTAGDCNDQVAAINPNGTIVVEYCAWQNPEYDCPRGSDKYPEETDQVHVRLTNNKCSTLSITDATVQTTVREAHGTFNFPGETFVTEHARFSPNSVPMGVGGDILVDAGLTCTNPRGGDSYNVYDASVTLQSSAGPLKCTAINGRTTRFPFLCSPSSGVSALPGTGH